MDLWYPDEDAPQLMAWWAPLIEASRRARQDKVLWPINVDEFMLMGRVDRTSAPSVWVYKHKTSRRELRVDDTGQAYRYTPTPNGRSAGRFTKITLHQAVVSADLPEFATETYSVDWDDWTLGEPTAPYPRTPPRPPHPAVPREPEERAPSARLRRPRRSRAHLTVIPGGLSNAG